MIVFVALGSAPRYTRTALAQARLANPGEALVLIHEARVRGWRTFAEAHRVDLYDIATLRSDARLREFYGRRDTRDPFRSGFWRHTSGRFFALRAFMERERVDAVTHLENDVLLYAPLTAFASWPPFREPVLATVFENGARAIPGIVRVGARAGLDAFTDMVLTQNAEGASDDMTRFGRFRVVRPDVVADLPTLPPAHASTPAVTRSLFSSGAPDVALPPGRWLFDGARFGQYLGGIDPRNMPGRLQRWCRWQHGRLQQPNGFINESCSDDPSRYAYRVTRPMGLAAPTVVFEDREYPLATLHVHSKKLSRFASAALEREAAPGEGRPA